MAARSIALALVASVGLAACTAPSQPYLDNARSGCLAGNQPACGAIPGLQSQVNFEHEQQAEKIAAGIMLGLAAAAAGAAAGYAASHPAPTYYYSGPVIVCQGWGC